MKRRTLAALLAGFALAGATPWQHALAQSARRIRGTIESLDGLTLTVRAREGQTEKVVLQMEYRVLAVVPAPLESIKPGAYIGTAAVGPKDDLRALEVLIFPDSMRGANEGHFAWDLVPESTMTNAAIEAEAAGTNGRTLTLVAKGERLRVTVPPDAPVVTFLPAAPEMLRPGAKVFIPVQSAPDGTLTAGLVAVGKDGLTPPM